MNQKKQKEVHNVEKLESESLKQYSHFLDLIQSMETDTTLAKYLYLFFVEPNKYFYVQIHKK